MPFVVDEPKHYNWEHNFGLAYKLTGFPHVRVKIFNNDPGLYLSFINLWDVDFIFDDYPTIVSTYKQTDALERFNPYVMWRNHRVFITAHFLGDLDPKWRESPTEINWWGPLDSREEARLLYSKRTINIEFKDFENDLKRNPRLKLYNIRKY